MGNIFNLTPLQSLFVLALNAWIFVIFPVIFIKKLNYMTDLMEGQYDSENQDA